MIADKIISLLERNRGTMPLIELVQHFKGGSDTDPQIVKHFNEAMYTLRKAHKVEYDDISINYPTVKLITQQ